MRVEENGLVNLGWAGSRRPSDRRYLTTVLYPLNWPLRTWPALPRSSASEKGLSRSTPPGSSLSWEGRTGWAGHEQHLDVRAEFSDAGGVFLSEHFGDDDVGEEQMDLPLVPGDERDGVGSAGGGEHAVAVAGKDPLGHSAERLFVLDDENGFALRVRS